MPASLILGVIDLPYGQDGEAPETPALTKKGKPRKPRARKGDATVATTATVAQILEDKYGVMGHFYDAHKADITGYLVDSLEGALETLYMGGSAPSDPFAGAGQDISKDFRTFLMTKEIETMGIEGVPTKAALDGVSHRFKGKKGERRPSFVDTGLLAGSMVAWVENK